MPLGMVKSAFNYDIRDKRLLNFDNVVNDDDNIKQDISIDVYGRKKEEAENEDCQGNADSDKEEEEEEDDLDSLLAS